MLSDTELQELDEEWQGWTFHQTPRHNCVDEEFYGTDCSGTQFRNFREWLKDAGWAVGIEIEQIFGRQLDRPNSRYRGDSSEFSVEDTLEGSEPEVTGACATQKRAQEAGYAALAASRNSDGHRPRRNSDALLEAVNRTNELLEKLIALKEEERDEHDTWGL